MNQQQQAQPQFNFEGGQLVMFHQEQTGLPMVRDANVNDRDRMQDLLSQEKYLSTSYNTALLEAGHQQLFSILQQNQQTCHQLQRQLFNTMFKKGWYRLPVADAQSVAHALQSHQQKQPELPFPSGIQSGGGGGGGMTMH